MFVLQVDSNITLRMLSARDAASLYKITNDSRDYLKKWLPWLDDTKSEEDSLSFIKNTFISYNNRTGMTAGIFFNHNLVGVIGFNYLDFNNKIGSIGYWLNQKDTGKGIMTKSVSSLITHGFRELDLNRIEIRCAAKNKRSRALPERLGFKQEGYLREVEWLYNQYVDHVVYGILAAEWE